MTETCEQCYFYHRDLPVEHEYKGECRRYAPFPRGKSNTLVIWPMTYPNDGCGDFKMKIGETLKKDS